MGWALWAGVSLGEGLCCKRQRGCTWGTLRLLNVIYCGGFGFSAFPSFPPLPADNPCPQCRRTSGQLPDAPIHSDGAGLAVGSASSLARGCGACKRGGHRWMLPSGSDGAGLAVAVASLLAPTGSVLEGRPLEVGAERGWLRALRIAP